MINDWFDRDIDAINKPRRPIPSEVVSQRAALALYFVLLAAIAACVSALPAPQGLWVAAWAALLHIYSWRARGSGWRGTSSQPLAASSAFLAGAYAAGGIPAGVVPAIFTFFFVLGRELVKDTEGIRPATANAGKDGPCRVGSGAVVTAAAVIFITLSALDPSSVYIRASSEGHTSSRCFFGAAHFLLYHAYFCLRRRSPAFVSLLLKLGCSAESPLFTRLKERLMPGEMMSMIVLRR